MKNFKKLMIIIGILAIIIVIAAIALAHSKKQEYPYGDPGDDEPTKEEIVKTAVPTSVTNPTMYYTAVECINTYLQYSSTKVPTGETREALEEAALTEQDRKTRVYDLLSAEYIQENNVTVENVRDYVHTAEYHLSFYPISMNMLTSESNNMISSYGAYGRLKDSGTGNFIGYAYITVVFDLNNNTFAVKPNRDDRIKSIADLSLKTNITSIEKNDHNGFSYEAVNEENLLKRYISTYKMYALYNPDIAYEYLDEEYRNTRFGSLENYKQYVEKNKDMILKISLDSYKKTKESGYTQYVCIDTNGNYYIFKETATLEIKIMLDTYTIDLPEFKTKYNSGNEQQKVGMNIEKIIAALNNKDYSYVYSKLATGFKNNYFQTQEQFEEYAKQNFFEYNIAGYTDFKNEGQNYMYTVRIQNRKKSSEATNRTIIMQLKSGTDFVFSFDVN